MPPFIGPPMNEHERMMATLYGSSSAMVYNFVAAHVKTKEKERERRIMCEANTQPSKYTIRSFE